MLVDEGKYTPLLKVRNLGSIEPGGSVSQFEGFGDFVHSTNIIRDTTLYLGSFFTNTLDR